MKLDLLSIGFLGVIGQWSEAEECPSHLLQCGDLVDISQYGDDPLSKDIGTNTLAMVHKSFIDDIDHID